MPKKSININFNQGLDLKTDPWQVEAGKFLSLTNSVFTKGGLLQKRNGYENLTALPNDTYAYLTTLNDNLTAVGPTIAAYSSGLQSWISKGTITPMQVQTLPLIRNNLNQTQVDAAVAPNGLVCTVYSELDDETTTYKYVVADSVTGQNITEPTVIDTSGDVQGGLRVFVLGVNFIITFLNEVSAALHLQYIAISTLNPTATQPAPTNIDTVVNPSTNVPYDGAVFDNKLYIAYNSTTGGQSIKVRYLTTQFILTAPVSFSNAAYKGALVSVCIDITTPSIPIIYVSFYNESTTNSYTFAVYNDLTTVFTPVQTFSSTTLANITSAAQNGVLTVFGEVVAAYDYDSGIPSNYITYIEVTQAGSVSSPGTSIRSVGLASKAFIISGTIYYLSAYQSTYQPSYFLINGSTSLESAPVIVGKLAYENGGGYLTLGLPSVTVTNGNTAQVGYLYKDLIEALSTNNNSIQDTAGGIYSQTGINLGTFTFTNDGIDTVELASTLQISGGFGYLYDGYLPVEENFFLWPDSVELAASDTSGSMSHQQYYYQVTYEWSDNNGNIYRSAPSIPVTITLTDKDSVTVYVPMLRLTMKTANPVKIVIYRWSVAQQEYFQVTSITAPVLNDTTADNITYTDTLSDAEIDGNNLIYTTGGVLENVNSPATNVLTIYDTRAWKIDAEDQNLLWFSKQVIENVPVEWSDLLTEYVAPNIGTASTTGPMKCLAPMDDKLVIFKANAMYYINGVGQGPDNTGANNNYGGPFFITSTVGSTNQNSIVLMQNGLMFQSDKGIWLLGRDLSTQYIGSPVENYTQFDAATGVQPLVTSAVNVPDTNQIRFTMSTGITLVYDYFYGQWSTFANVSAISSCIYENLHTFINSYGLVYQETPNEYMDGDNAVLMSFSSSWYNLASLQGYERFYWFYLLANYLSPHLLNVQIAYNYVPTIVHSSLIKPRNFSSAVPSPYGDQPAPFGSPPSLEQWRIHAKQQLCQSFQITINEVYDPSYGVPPGAGFTMSGLNITVELKKATRPIPGATTTG